MNSGQHFKAGRHEDGPAWNRQSIRTQIAACCRCGAEGQITDNGGKPLAVSKAAEKFRHLGWKIGSRRNSDICPTCAVAKPKPATPVGPPAGALPVPPQEPPMPPVAESPTAQPPRQPSPEVRRRIRAALDEAYQEDAGCYLGDGSDALMATRLDVPRAWVAEVREAGGYGPDENADGRKRAKDLADYETRLGEITARHLSLAEEAEALQGQVRAAIKALPRKAAA